MGKKQRSRINQIVLSHLSQIKGEIVVASLCIIGFTLTALAAPWPIKLIFDHILLDKPTPPYLAYFQGDLYRGSVPALAALSLAIVVIALFRGIFSYYQLYLTSRTGYQLVYRLRGELFDHLQRLSLSFHTRARSGELLSKITSDTNMLKDVFAESALNFTTQLLTFVGMFAVMFFLNWKLSLIVLASFPVLFLAMFFIFKNFRLSARKQRKSEGHLASRISETLQAASLVQTFGTESYERERFNSKSAESLEESIRAARIDASASRVVEIISAVGTGIGVLFGGLQVFQGGMTPGDLLIFTNYISNLYKPVRLMAKLATKFSSARVSTERISEILEIEPDIEDAPNAVKACNLKGPIIFDGVSFAYETDQPILKNVSFTIAPGQRVALVGASGAGKSTIASLILRLYDPREGTVSIDGIDLKLYQRASLRREIGVVLQDTFLFGASIRENIAYGKPDATFDEIVEAAQQVRAHDFITALPKGYDTVLGERGGTLSGGQRQRLCVARAIIKRPSILIMDEPTSAVDADSEALIRDAVDRLQQGKTTLLIAHRFSWIKDYDHILVLKNGSVIEQGTHEQLVKLGGYYYELFCLQGG